MVTAQERLKVLEMLEAGKISSDEAAKLLIAVGEEDAHPAAVGRGRWLTIRVKEGEKTAVNVRIPLKLAEWALRLVPEKYLEKQGITGVEILELVRQVQGAGKTQLIDVHDGGEHIQIAIE